MKHNIPAILWALVILILTLMPGKFIPPAGIFEIFHPDKLVHMVIFATLIILLLRGLLKQDEFPLLKNHAWVVAFGGSTFYGFVLEVMQGTLLPDRYFEWLDTTANTIGCLAGMGLFRYYQKTAPDAD